jgi:hypothetical protein
MEAKDEISRKYSQLPCTFSLPSLQIFSVVSEVLRIVLVTVSKEKVSNKVKN